MCTFLNYAATIKNRGKQCRVTSPCMYICVRNDYRPSLIWSRRLEHTPFYVSSTTDKTEVYDKSYAPWRYGYGATCVSLLWGRRGTGAVRSGQATIDDRHWSDGRIRNKIVRCTATHTCARTSTRTHATHPGTHVSVRLRAGSVGSEHSSVMDIYRPHTCSHNRKHQWHLRSSHQSAFPATIIVVDRTVNRPLYLVLWAELSI